MSNTIEGDAVMARGYAEAEKMDTEARYTTQDVPRTSALSRQFDELGKSVEVYGALLAELGERLDPILSPVQTIEARREDDDREPESRVVTTVRDRARSIYGLNERLRLLIDRIEA